MSDFMNFIRTQGVVGLAVGLILGDAVSGVVKSVVNDLVNPLVGLLLNSAEGLTSASFKVFGASIMYGSFINTLINFVIIAGVVYFGVKKLGLDKMDKKD
ncbi:MAG: hypothetical protein RI996_50 [Candidatus Parcubacteria bacterium]|jgi:large conductance mechanosensitive channel